MRVALSGYFWGHETTGSGQYLHRLVAAILQQNPEISITLLVPSSACNSARWPDDVACTVLPTPFDGRSRQLAKLWFEQIAVPGAARAVGADLLHVPYFAPPLVCPLPVCATVHDLIPMVMPAYRGNLLVRGYTALVARAARRADVILADSNASRKDILSRLSVSPERVRTVYLAADESYRPQGPDEIVRVRAKYHLPERFVLYLGGFDVRKNVPLLLQATNESEGDWAVVIAGDVPVQNSDFFPNPRTLSGALGLDHRALFTGWVEEGDKPALLASATVFCYPSAYEGFGLPILEAMACGTATVTTNSSSLPELAGDGAILVPAGDANALREALDTLMANDAGRVELAQQGMRQARRFSWARCADETVAAYRWAARGQR